MTGVHLVQFSTGAGSAEAAARVVERYGPDDVVLLTADTTVEDPLRAPLMEPPLIQKAELLGLWRSRGIEPPRLYDLGFAHANCGGACVRAGQAQWALLWRTDPELYLRWEAEEETTRALIGKDVAILRDRSGGEHHPLTLRRFRQERLPEGDYDRSDWGACGCDPMGPDEVAVELAHRGGDDER